MIHTEICVTVITNTKSDWSMIVVDGFGGLKVGCFGD